MRRSGIALLLVGVLSVFIWRSAGASLTGAQPPTADSRPAEHWPEGQVSCRVPLEVGSICFEQSLRSPEDAFSLKTACQQHGAHARFLSGACSSEFYLGSCRRLLKDSLGALLFESRVVYAHDKWDAPSDWNNRLAYHRSNCETTGGVWETSLSDIR